MASSRRVKTRNSITGEESEGTLMEIVEAKEPFSRIVLANGTEIEAKMVTSQVVLLDNPGPDGKPQYNITSHMIMNIHHGDNS